MRLSWKSVKQYCNNVEMTREMTNRVNATGATAVRRRLHTNVLSADVQPDQEFTPQDAFSIELHWPRYMCTVKVRPSNQWRSVDCKYKRKKRGGALTLTTLITTWFEVVPTTDGYRLQKALFLFLLMHCSWISRSSSLISTDRVSGLVAPGNTSLHAFAYWFLYSSLSRLAFMWCHTRYWRWKKCHHPSTPACLARAPARNPSTRRGQLLDELAASEFCPTFHKLSVHSSLYQQKLLIFNICKFCLVVIKCEHLLLATIHWIMKKW